MNTILILIESRSQLEFFSRLCGSFARLGYSVIFLSTRLSVHLYCRSQNFNSVLTGADLKHRIFLPTGSLSEVKDHIFTETQAQKYISSVYSTAEMIHLKTPLHCIMVWGGGDTAASAAVMHLAEEQKIKTLYFDRANLPGKIIVDPAGMNFNSTIAVHPSLLDDDRETKETFLSYQQAFKKGEIQSLQHSRPITNWLFPLDLLHSLYTDLPYRGWRMTKAVKDIHRLPDEQLPSSPFCFIPLSHSFEFKKEAEGITAAEQLVKKGREEADRRACELFVKFHPAENDDEFIRFVEGLKPLYYFRFTSAPGRTLIERSEVITASNTSVALEAMMLERPVIHVGRSLFGRMNTAQLQNYIAWYLLDADANSSEPVSESTALRILERMELR